MWRKKALVGSDPLKLSAIIYEPALRYVVGSPEVMREQYDEITKLAELDTVTIQVLPQSLRGYLCPHDITLLDLGELPPVVQVDAGGGPSVTDKPRDVARFQRQFDAMARSARPPEDTPELLHHLSREIIG